MSDADSIQRAGEIATLEQEARHLRAKLERAEAERVALLDSIRLVAARLRNAGADLPAPQHSDAIKGAHIGGLSIALLLVEFVIDAAETSRLPKAREELGAG